MSFTEVVRGMFNLSWVVDWFRVERTATKPDKHSSHLSGENPDDEKPMMIT